MTMSDVFELICLGFLDERRDTLKIDPVNSKLMKIYD